MRAPGHHQQRKPVWGKSGYQQQSGRRVTGARGFYLPSSLLAIGLILYGHPEIRR